MNNHDGDEDVALSESAIKALEEFYKEQEQLNGRVVEENWVTVMPDMYRQFFNDVNLTSCCSLSN
jgi:hypothetical protein